MSGKDQCAICGREAKMSLVNTREIYCEDCFNRVLSDPVLLKQRINIGRGNEGQLFPEGLENKE